MQVFRSKCNFIWSSGVRRKGKSSNRGWEVGGGVIAIKGDSSINKSTLISTLRDMFIFKGASDSTRRNSGHFIRCSLVDLHQLIIMQILKELISTKSSQLPFSSKCGCCGSPFSPKFLVQSHYRALPCPPHQKKKRKFIPGVKLKRNMGTR